MSSLMALKNVLQRAALARCARLNTIGLQVHQEKLENVRWMSARRKGFISELLDNFKSEMEKDKKFKENVKKFQEDAKKLEQSESLIKAREKYKAIESETLKGSDAIKKKISDFQETVSQSKYAKKSVEMMEDVAESMSKQTESIAQSSVYKTISHGVKAVGEEIVETTSTQRHSLYEAPVKLRKRDEYSLKFGERRPIKPDEETTNVVVNKNSQWYQNWEEFKNNNKAFEKLFDMKAKFYESDNMIISATRTITDRVSQLVGGVFTKTELSEVLTEIMKIDPSFETGSFLELCQFDFIPNILEAVFQGDLEILRDWCHEGAYNILSQSVKQAKDANYKFENNLLDISHLDLVYAKMVDQCPVLAVNFVTQQILVTRDSLGNIVQGDPNKIVKIRHVWAFCRDQQVYDPKAAWKLLENHMQEEEQWI